MESKCCENCEYFRQHYTINDGQIFRVYCGHCVQGRSKVKRPDCAACGEFVPGTSVEDMFVRKEYLTKELLRHLLNMELLPPIKTPEETDISR